MDVNINVKLLEIISNLLHDQNMQLLQIIAEEEKIPYRQLIANMPSRYEIKRDLDRFAQAAPYELRLPDLPEKSNSTSESSSSVLSASASASASLFVSEPDVE